MVFTKGQIPWNKGKKETRIEVIEKLRKAHLGKVAWNKGLKGYNAGEEHPLYGKYHTEEAKEKNRIAHLGKFIGKLNPNWQGGKSFEPYSPEFNNNLKEQIRKRDGYRCQQCFRHQDELFKNTKAGIKPYKLYIHHIDYNKENNNPNNLISLCLNCHLQTNYERKDWTKYYQNKINKGGY